jgi:hypothetical protein
MRFRNKFATELSHKFARNFEFSWELVFFIPRAKTTKVETTPKFGRQAKSYLPGGTFWCRVRYQIFQTVL